MPATGFAIEDIDALVIDGTVPLGWNLQSSKVTYGLIDKLFVSLEQCFPTFFISRHTIEFLKFSRHTYQKT